MHDPKAQDVSAISPPPTADWHSAWTQLRGYVEEAVADGGPVDATALLAYMDELKAEALKPFRGWMKELSDGA